MLELFTSQLKDLYKRLISGDQVSLDINFFRNRWGEEKLGEVYQKLCKKELKKDMGSFYTPFEIVDYMVHKLLEGFDYSSEKFVKILDPSCGGGYFLFRVYKTLLEKARYAGLKNPEQHILKYNLFGCDTDEVAVAICMIEFYELTGLIAKNIVVKDFLLEYDEEVNLIIGNPPYLGHKRLDKAYREKLGNAFGDVFYNKGDLSYCFIKKSIDALGADGKLMFFTSRYMLEALSGNGIREYIKKQGFVSSIIDFYGVRVVKGAGVDTIIFEFTNKNSIKKTEVFRLKENAAGIGSKIFCDIKTQQYDYVHHRTVNLQELSSKGFSFLTEQEQGILEKIRGNILGELCESYQGIITGCDKAFVMKRNRAEELEIEKTLVKPWLKNKNIKPFTITPTDEVIIYSDQILDEEKYENALKFINRYRENLEKRRECKKGSRKWYELQWGRSIALFEGEKIIFPYKAASNRFAIDKGHCFSADVYCITLMEQFKPFFSYEYLVGVLNSSLYEFYIKSFAKKLGDDLYDYYPNKIMTIRIPDYIPEIENAVRSKREDTRKVIDEILNRHFSISEIEFEIIRSWCKN